ncbi:MAG: DNA repair protein RadC [Firmicutes bacterium]|nr:DNA repair protein RadC [Bacillota bacterium]
MEYRLTIKDLPEDERPREKLRAHGVEQLSVGELLAIVIGSGTPTETAVGLADRLLISFGGLRGLLQAGAAELMEIRGIGLAKAAQICAALEVGRRIAVLSPEVRQAVNTPADVSKMLMPQMRYMDKEHFQVLFLNTKNQLLGKKVVSIGSLNASIVHPRELFRESIRYGSAAVILAHNHPSGDPTPSQEDLAMTRRVAEGGRLLGIEVLDHVIIGDNRFVSLKERGLM